MITTNTYLGFSGTCEEAMNFYAELLGGKIIMMMRMGDAPGDHPPEMKNQIMHARISIGDTVLMASDAPPGRHSKPQGFSVSVSVDEPAEADRIYAGLAKGGTEIMPIAETFWAKRFGMCIDRFGTPWMVNCEKPMGA